MHTVGMVEGQRASHWASLNILAKTFTNNLKNKLLQERIKVVAAPLV